MNSSGKSTPRLENILKVEQKKRLGERSGGFALPGQILSRSSQIAAQTDRRTGEGTG